MRTPAQSHPSEQGFFILSQRQTGVTPRQAIVGFREVIDVDLEWADLRKKRYRRRAVSTKVASLVLAALSTVALGVNLGGHGRALALPMVAAVTVLAGIEPYMSWRSRWVSMEETRYELNRLRDEIDYYLVTTSAGDQDQEQLRIFFADQQRIWRAVSKQWREFRASDAAAPTPGLRDG
ncbi:SLATT domain-containing protein [Micromonospora chalcea]|uniref:SLATT domain-containing protein n=1 Tax=Micromonospora chalcea TaxID=1874 RepID=UPI0033FCFE58